MKLAEALAALKTPVRSDARPYRVALACGFEPLHFSTFLKVYLRRLLPGRDLIVNPGLFGDLPGNIERIDRTNVDGIVVMLEWSDLDPRLGVRQAGTWNRSVESEIVDRAAAALGRLESAIAMAGDDAPVTICGPTLPPAPFAHTPGWIASGAELALDADLAAWLRCVGSHRNVRVVSPGAVDRICAVTARRDIKSEILSGFPYQLPFASSLAETVAHTLAPPVPKKGLITDLDDTLWAGILGEAGPDHVHWDLENKSQAHGLYQQMLHSLAESGVLLAIASKNDRNLVDKALAREDLLINSRHFFPIEAGWGRKSEAVRRILQAWNIGEDMAVFIDDSPMELAEVQAACPAMECLRFTPGDPAQVHDLLYKLRNRFGKWRLSEEDGIRAASLRQSAAGTQGSVPAVTADEFLQNAGAVVTIDQTGEPLDPRALELVNKTNQFNLNGRRWQESEWRRYLRQSDTVYLLTSYLDRFGPLGKIAVIAGQKRDRSLCIETWVMSCRAFSRRIEDACLDFIFEEIGIEDVEFTYLQTDRNSPVREMLDRYFDGGPDQSDRFVLSRERFRERRPRLFHTLRTPACLTPETV